LSFIVAPARIYLVTYLLVYTPDQWAHILAFSLVQNRWLTRSTHLFSLTTNPQHTRESAHQTWHQLQTPLYLPALGFVPVIVLFMPLNARPQRTSLSPLPRAFSFPALSLLSVPLKLYTLGPNPRFTLLDPHLLAVTTVFCSYAAQATSP